MSLFDEVRAATRETGGVCSVGKAIREMGADGAELVAVMADPSVLSRPISRVLQARHERDGIPSIRIAEETIRRHRRGECKCPSATS